MKINPTPGPIPKKYGTESTLDQIIEKSTPAVRLIGTEGSAKDIRLVEDAGVFRIQKNTGSKASPVWSDLALYSEAASNYWSLTGGIQEVFAHLIPKGGSSGVTHEGNVTISTPTNLSGIHLYNNFTLNASTTVTVPASSGRLAIICRGTCTINGTIAANGAGATQTATVSTSAGQTGLSATDQAGGGGGGETTNGGGAGGNAFAPGTPSWASSFYKMGGAAGASSDGNGGPAVQITGLQNWLDILQSWGGAAGGSGGCTTPSGTLGYGGPGGASLIVLANAIVFGASAVLNTAGGNGGNGQDSPRIGGGGGGGAGNQYYLTRNGFYTDSGATFTLSGGTPGTVGASGDGGPGAAGVKYVWLF